MPALCVLALLPHEYLNHKAAEQDVNVFAALGFFRSDPSPSALQVQLRPLQGGDVALPQTSGQREQHHIPLMLRQLSQQGLRLLWRDPANSRFGFRYIFALRHLTNPLPLKARKPQNRADQRQHPVGSVSLDSVRLRSPAGIAEAMKSSTCPLDAYVCASSPSTICSSRHPRCTSVVHRTSERPSIRLLAGRGVLGLRL